MGRRWRIGSTIRYAALECRRLLGADRSVDAVVSTTFAARAWDPKSQHGDLGGNPASRFWLKAQPPQVLAEVRKAHLRGRPERP
jgi:hypothetical protein